MSRQEVFGTIHLSRADWKALFEDFSLQWEKHWVKDLALLWTLHAKMKAAQAHKNLLNGPDLSLEVIRLFREVQEDQVNRFRVTTTADVLSILTTEDKDGAAAAKLQAPALEAHPQYRQYKRLNPLAERSHNFEIVSQPEGQERAGGVKLTPSRCSITMSFVGPQEGVGYMLEHPLLVRMLEFMSKLTWKPHLGGAVYIQPAGNPDRKKVLYAFGPLGIKLTTMLSP